MSEHIDSLEKWLKRSNTHVLKIRVAATNKLIERPNKSEKSKYPSNIYLNDIATTGKTLQRYLNDLYNLHESELLIEVRKTHGSTTKPIKGAPAIKYSVAQQKPEQNMQQQQPINHAPPVQQSYQQPVSNNVPGMSAQQMHLVDLQVKANESDKHLKSYYEEKEKNLELQRKLNELTAENVKLEKFKETALEKMELAKEKAEFKAIKDKKGFADSELAQSLLGLLPELAAAFKPGSSANIAQGQNSAAANFSQDRIDLLNAIQDPNVSDDVVVLIKQVVQGLLSNQEFINELYELISKHNL